MVSRPRSNFENHVLQSGCLASASVHGFLDEVMFCTEVEGEGEFVVAQTEGDTAEGGDETLVEGEVGGYVVEGEGG
jgi:hypothetical protein